MIKQAISCALVIATCAVTLGTLSGCGSKKDSGKVLNYEAPKAGEEIVTISVKDYGDIKIKLFEKEMPDACKNFTQHAKEGYYDELTFHRVISDFMIQGGDPMGTGTGGEVIDSLKGKDFGTSDSLIHLPGAVAYANSGSTSTNGSQFYIVTGATKEELSANFDQYAGQNKESEEAKKLYLDNGGYPFLDGSYTVFGQVIDGLDVAYKIAAITDKDQNDKPYTSVVMDKVTVEEYDGFNLRQHVSDYDDIILPGDTSEEESGN